MSKPRNLLRPHPSPENCPTGPQKSQNNPKKRNIKSQKTKNFTKRKLSVYKIKAPNTFPTHLNPKHNPIEPKKAENEQKKSKV